MWPYSIDDFSVFDYSCIISQFYYYIAIFQIVAFWSALDCLPSNYKASQRHVSQT